MGDSASKRNRPKGRPRTTHSWIVYPPNYGPGDGYHKFRSLKKARGKAIAIGLGSELTRVTRVFGRDGSETVSWDYIYIYRRNPRYGRPVVNEPT